ncbi:N-acetyl-ornithine/N-acetyl-lysine deacetylase [Haloterrigena turkmenica DSM 5511]|uniref:Putative [LysW]-lysine/[LysW]-ornithine hydrolase n=1 Tax=Haloterrigena turkmenica (strain ATCC 51198 / DSM 5511 / JCM 9101 / NCIMB 13204 / VKM B-1734 / 4k) TaxID=543526 RepID=D2RUT2_HALTV|nr:[LysW]-lysine hydrolase [Haloterrigena turkmenica]ADB59225.1 N-acetyl-ornithine/N-acetyl-lysine deacetylase [Haloterrigena turkmenica DSM 5511]
MNADSSEPTDVSAAEARELLIDLVSIPSPTREEREAAKRLVEFFEVHDREVWIDAVGNVRAPADDAVLLTSHIDTVPGDIPVEVEESGDDEILWGRGSVDATGPLAAMAAAAVRTGVSFVGVVGEEVDSKGSRYLVDDREEQPDAVVNGEPSGADGITLGYRGLIAGTYVATSESGHTSRPDPNAIQHAVRWWSAVEEYFEGDEYEPVFEQVTTKPVDIEGGVSDDGLSVEATMDVQLRVPPALDVGAVREATEAELEVGTVTWKDKVPPVMMSPRTEVARAFRVAIRKEGGDPRLVRKTGTSDMNIYAGAWDCPMVTYGPGDSDLDHAPDERLPLSEFDQSVSVLERVARTLSEQ